MLILLTHNHKIQIFCVARYVGTGGVGANATAPSSDEQKPTEKSPLKTDSKNKYAAGEWINNDDPSNIDILYVEYTYYVEVW